MKKIVFIGILLVMLVSVSLSCRDTQRRADDVEDVVDDVEDALEKTEESIEEGIDDVEEHADLDDDASE